LQQRGWFTHYMRSQDGASSKSNRGHAKPEEFTTEYQDDGSDYRAQDGNGKVQGDSWSRIRNRCRQGLNQMGVAEKIAILNQLSALRHASV
jgi:hypothetical protein